jgi:hypothetical protein
MAGGLPCSDTACPPDVSCGWPPHAVLLGSWDARMLFSDKNVGTFQKYWSAFYQNTGENVSKMFDPVFPLNKCRCTSFQVR